MFQIVIDHLPENDEMEVVRSTTSIQDYAFEHAVTGRDLIEFQRLVRKVPVSEPVLRYAVNLVRASRPSANGTNASLLPGGSPDFIKEWVSYGASVRAAQYLSLGGKARALMRGRTHVSFEDIKALAHPILRHRILPNFHAESEKVTTDQIIDRLLEVVPVPRSGM
jgi:MoxR-like ATPase